MADGGKRKAEGGRRKAMNSRTANHAWGEQIRKPAEAALTQMFRGG